MKNDHETGLGKGDNIMRIVVAERLNLKHTVHEVKACSGRFAGFVAKLVGIKPEEFLSWTYRINVFSLDCPLNRSPLQYTFQRVHRAHIVDRERPTRTRVLWCGSVADEVYQSPKFNGLRDSLDNYFIPHPSGLNRVWNNEYVKSDSVGKIKNFLSIHE